MSLSRAPRLVARGGRQRDAVAGPRARRVGGAAPVPRVQSILAGSLARGGGGGDDPLQPRAAVGAPPQGDRPAGHAARLLPGPPRGAPRPVARAEDGMPEGGLRPQTAGAVELLHRAPDRRPLRSPPGPPRSGLEDVEQRSLEASSAIGERSRPESVGWSALGSPQGCFV